MNLSVMLMAADRHRVVKAVLESHTARHIQHCLFIDVRKNAIARNGYLS